MEKYAYKTGKKVAKNSLKHLKLLTLIVNRNNEARAYILITDQLNYRIKNPDK